jgi:methylated-DNA-[protein]-cysteine S-methyltransferase
MSEITLYHHTLHLGNRDWTLWATDKGLIRLSFGREQALAAGWLKTYAPVYRYEEAPEVFDRLGITREMENYFAGVPVSFSGIDLDLWGTPFQREVWTGLATIPHGEVITYRELAGRIGRPQAMRAVGTANGQNPLPLILPCHRVIGTNGTLTGYRGGLKLKQELLALEGITHMGAAGHERFAF